MFYFPPGGKTVETYPIGAGVEGRNTPLGVTRIVTKQVHPGWAVPPSIRAERPELPAYMPPGPDNPMGDLAMGLAWRGYYLHGTNKPYGVGRNVSHGCIHFYPEDIDRLFHEVPVGTQVRVINQEVATGWIDNRLYVAVFPNKEQVDEIDIEHPMTPCHAARSGGARTRRGRRPGRPGRLGAGDASGMVRNGIPTARDAADARPQQSRRAYGDTAASWTRCWRRFRQSKGRDQARMAVGKFEPAAMQPRDRRRRR